MTSDEIIERLERHRRSAEEYLKADTVRGASADFCYAAAYGYLVSTIVCLVRDLRREHT